MSLTRRTNRDRKPPRGFAVLAATAVISATVGLSGFGFAADQPKFPTDTPPKFPVKVPKKQEPLGIPAKPVAPELGTVIEFKGIEDLSRPVLRLSEKQMKELQQFQGGGDFKEIIEKIAKANKDGQPDELKAIMQELQKSLQKLEPLGPLPGVPQLAPIPLQPLGRPVVVNDRKSDLREQYEKQLKEFEELIQKAEGKDAKEQLEKTRDEYKKAMEEGLKKADAARKNADVAQEDIQREQNRAMAELREMKLRMMDDRRRFALDVPNVFGGAIDPFGRPANGTQARLGVKLEKISAVLAEQLDLPKDSGLVIAGVFEKSPAEAAGFKANDIILSLAGKEVPTDPEAFQAAVAKLKAGEKFEAVVMRKGKKETLKGIELPEVKAAVRGGGGFNQFQVQIENDSATIQAQKNGVNYSINGEFKDGKLVPTKITVGDTSYDSLEKVPEADREVANAILARIRGVGR